MSLAFIQRIDVWRAANRHGVRSDLFWLALLALLLIASGLGLRQPWPADEPRFVLIARDMLASGEWLFPHIGGELYAEKPPLYFWLLATCFWLTGSVKWSFLLPSALAGVGTVLLIYDLARRLWNREVGVSAALLLLATFQFVWQARQAQIDAVLCFWTTLSAYGLLRYLLLGSWRWSIVGWAEAGYGVITKGVGFLPLLLLPLHWLWLRKTAGRTIRAWLGPLAFLAAVSVWLIPMVLASQDNPQLRAYRDEILFHQTIDRYTAAWHHREPFWYYLVAVIPPLWLPLSALLPWLWSHWRAAFAVRDARVGLPLLWVLTVVLFFSLSTGKRGVYVLPATPLLALAAAPYWQALTERIAVRRVLIGIAMAIPIIAALVFGYLQFASQQRAELEELYGVESWLPLLAMAIGGAVVTWLLRTRPFAAYLGNLLVLFALIGFWVNPGIDAARSGVRLTTLVEQAVATDEELGLVAYPEQYLLHATRPTVNFGRARWRTDNREAFDAAAWLQAGPRRVLLVAAEQLKPCFANAQLQAIGSAHRRDWFLVRGAPAADCVAQGDLAAARHYTPPVHGQGYVKRLW